MVEIGPRRANLFLPRWLLVWILLMLPPLDLHSAITRIVREQWGRLLAAMTASIGDLELAEDVLQDAVTTALEHWKQHGIPESPSAWLLQTAKHKAIDRFRRDKRFSELQSQLSYELDLANEQQVDSFTLIPDKRLELIFTCCHPAIDERSRIALTLHTLGGLSTNEIANAYLVSTKTMAQRLVRAKKKITLAQIPFVTPEQDSIKERVSAVLAVLYLIFNEGYSSSTGLSPARQDLSNEAIRLARILNDLMPEQAEVKGLLALMLLHDARRHARISDKHQFIPLQSQNRQRWDQEGIKEGSAMLKFALQQQQLGTYQLQACISAIHAESPSWEQTDWQQIAALYHLLYEMQPTPVVRVNQAVAISYAQSEKQALKLLETIENLPAMRTYQPFFAAKADIFSRLGRTALARECLVTAVELTENTIEKTYLQNKLDKLK